MAARAKPDAIAQRYIGAIGPRWGLLAAGQGRGLTGSTEDSDHLPIHDEPDDRAMVILVLSDEIGRGSLVSSQS